MQKYDPKKIEKKWQKYWEKNKIFEVKEDAKKQKFYSLIEFPYPSGAGLHVGHPRPFTAMDVISRKKRMEGFNVLYPIGFDAFGLPTENFAIKTGRPPAEVTAENIATFTRQLKALGYSFDWSRAVDTTDPKYYKWTQWIFLQLFKHGLAYKKLTQINWCPKDKIGLANEEAAGGVCDRCGGPVEKRDKEQWMLAITKYADKLLDGLKEVDYITPARVQQENWIGRSEGATVRFSVIASNVSPVILSEAKDLGHSELDSSATPQNDNWVVEVFTTRPDTLFGATYMVLAPEHELVKNLESGILNLEEVAKYIKEVKNKSEQERTAEDKEKTGVELKGIKAINPASGEKIPVWIADYVLSTYGTGAIMAVPAHDERDFEFAKKYGLAIKQVVAPYVVYTGSDAPRSEQNITKFDAATAIIKHWEKDLFYVVHFSDFLQGFVGGRVESGETKFQTAQRETIEESGYADIKDTQLLFEHAYGRGYKSRKSREEECHDAAFIVTLASDDRTTIIDHETKRGYWMSAEEILKLSTFSPAHLLFFEHYIKNKTFTGAGLLVNSGEFDGINSETAKEKMITWLEEKGIGKRQVNYKLRDWVFSRQRYWGEPIPLVYCEACKDRKYNYIIIHGLGSSSKVGFKPWLKLELEKRGHAVWSPDLPDTETPNIEKQVNYILDNAPFTIDENTVLVGHSLGGVVIYKLLEKIKTNIRKAVLVDPVYKPEFNDKPRPAVEASVAWEFDWKKIKSKASKFIILEDRNNPVIKHEHLLELNSLVQGDMWMVQPSVRHFSSGGNDAVTQEPEILQAAVSCGWIPLPESELPLKLPEVKNYQPTDTGESPLSAMTDWVNTTCPRCGSPAKRETDTMPNWAGSSWYFLRYCDPDNNKEFASMEKLQYWMGHNATQREATLPRPLLEREGQLLSSSYQEGVGGVAGGVDWYNGGMEHTVLHLLYSRFWNQFLFDIGVVPTREPYKKRTSHGMILGPDGEKMSKSRGNVINPDEMIEQFGTDAFRTYIGFMGPFDQAVKWDTNGLIGVRRFLDRVWNLQDRVSPVIPNEREESSSQLSSKTRSLANARDDSGQLTTFVHQTIKKVSNDIEKMNFNTAIAALMELTNALTKEEKISKAGYRVLIKLLSPFAPHIAEELWEKFGDSTPLAYSAWPVYDEALTQETIITIVVQVNGKVRDELSVPADFAEDEIKKLALASEKVQKWLEGKVPKKVIYVKGKLVSVVV